MSVDLSQFHQVFIDEAYEHLATMENLLLAVDLDDPNLDDLNAIFRAAHSIKGGAGTFGFTDIADLTHALETLLDRLRKQELEPTDEMIEAFLQASDLLGRLLDAHQQGEESDQEAIQANKAELIRLAEADQEVAADQPSEPPLASASPQGGEGHWLIQLHPKEDVFAKGASHEAINEDLKALGPLEILQQPAEGKASWRLQADVGREQLEEIFAWVCEPQEVTFSREEAPLAEPSDDDGFGFFVDEKDLPAAQDAVEADQGFGFFVDTADLPAAKEQQEADQGYGFFVDEQELPIKQAADEKASAGSVSREVSKPTSPAKAQSKTSVDTSIRVGVEKVDQLINLVGELVITRSMLAQSLSVLDPIEHENIHNGLANLERNSRDLQEAVMSIRMLPINFVFGRFPRVVRDLTKKMHKKVKLKLVGEETELDKGLIEKLSDPLTHLVRNSIDHGIESPEERVAAGKPEEGTITLSASHQGGSILVEIHDDGAGLNREKLLAKAQEKGVPLSDNPTDKEVWQLIFAAGFSTAKEVTDVSGRGVGMDVVSRNISEMKGQIEIDSVEGEGTRIGLRLPLTLAILDGMSLRVGDEVFILPLTRILESLQPDKSQLKTVAGKGRVVHIRGEYLPLVPLYKVFNLEPRVTKPEQGILVVVESIHGKLALFVDELIAQDQVVIKSLETHYRKVEGISGATIMGDGRVALIIDIERLAKMNA
ncbi:two-component system, chemotaxis family, sensor kinase CheA [Marinospirillum celere]|uniref:Chemotaxis protein CheA n=1 Tax=Marinospirillum celere TaxID=1122252 RepID=A0A1I1ECC4_9GAMM|nr:chemotaxis protein CheW [Marinospirillum celere]SFB84745.1 two-component system, chemotaxis family, sensor kinase CheA [Marinospirillum celere]